MKSCSYIQDFFIFQILSLKVLGIVSLGSTYTSEQQFFVPITQILTDQTRCCPIPRLLIAESLALLLSSGMYLFLYLLLLKLSYFSKFIQDFKSAWRTSFESLNQLYFKIYQNVNRKELVENNLFLRTSGEQSLFNLLCMFLNNRELELTWKMLCLFQGRTVHYFSPFYLPLLVEQEIMKKNLPKVELVFSNFFGDHFFAMPSIMDFHK